MGGAVDVVSDVIGGVKGIAGGVANSIPVIGPYVGPVVSGALLGPAAGIKSLAFNAATGQYSGGGGGSSGGSSAPKYAEPTYSYGANTYQMGNSPVDTSKYFITGDKGVYNLLPALGQIDAKTLSSSNPMYTSGIASSANNKRYYTPYEAYTDLSAQMANDPKALAAFQSMYQPTTPTSKRVSPYVDFGLGSSIGNNATYGDIASYASTNQNPYFVPYSRKYGKASTFTPPEVLAAQQKAEEKARFDRMSPEKQQAILAEQKAAMKNFTNRIFGNKPAIPTQNQSLLSNVSTTGNNKGNSLLGNQTTSKSNTSKK
jgi:hypothetical protein